MAKPSRRKLTPKRRRFVKEIQVDWNQTAAAIRAGYSARTAKQQASRLMRQPEVKAAVQAALDAQQEETELRKQRAVAALERIAHADIRDFFTWEEERAAFVPSRDLTSLQASPIVAVKAKTTRRITESGAEFEDITLELKLADKLGALDKLMRHLGGYVDRVEHDHRVEVVDADELRRRVAGRIAALAARAGSGPDPRGPERG